MYAAKRAKAGYQIYSADQPEFTPRRVALIGELRRGIDQDQLLLHYQPKINLRTRAVEGVEALVRWLHPREGLLGPVEFVGMAEDTGLIKPLTFWVLHTALLQCRVWHQMGASLNVAVNLAVDMLREPELVEIVAAHLESTDALPEWLTLEVTESAVMADPEHAREMLARLRRHRGTDLDRRLRHGVFLPGLPAGSPGERGQDRPVVRDGDGLPRARRLHRPLGHRPGA